MTDVQARAAEALKAEFRSLKERFPDKLAGVELRFNARLKARFGQCKFRRRTAASPWKAVRVEVAKFALKDPEKAMDTLLHEVAHAIAGREANHGPKWRRVAVSLGCAGNRCGTIAKEHRPTPKYTGTCTECGQEYTRHRKSKKMGVGYTCGVREGGRRCAGAVEWVETATGRRVRVKSPRERQVTRELEELFGF